MINYCQLFVGTPATNELDLSQEFQINLNYSISDIRDISRRNSSFSKTVILPGTKRNNTILGNLYDPNTDFTYFNPNVKTPCQLVVNSQPVMTGFLQLRNIKKLNNTDQWGNLIYWEVVIYNNTVDLFTELGEKTMNQLELPELTHDYTFNNIVYSWTQSWTDGWVYPMYGFEQQPSTYGVEDFYPGYYSKYLLNSILQQAGFGWTGSLKSNAQFEKEIIPFVGSGSQSISQETIDEKAFRVGITQSYVITSTHSSVNTSGAAWSLRMTGNSFLNPTLQFGFGTGDFLGFGYQQYLLPEDNFLFPLNPVEDLYDRGGEWDAATSVWTTTRKRKYSPIWRLNYDYVITNLSQFKIWSSSLGQVDNSIPLRNYWNYMWFDFEHTLEYSTVVNLFGQNITIWVPWDTAVVTRKFNTGGPGTQSISGVRAGEIAPGASHSVNVNIYRNSNDLVLETGTKVRLKVKVTPSSNCPENEFTYLITNPNGSTQSLYLPSQGDIQLTWRNPDGSARTGSNSIRTEIIPRVQPQNFLFNNGIPFAAQEGDQIFARDFLGSKLKQKDFLTDLIKRYNLYIQVDKNNERQLIIDTRTDFYSRELLLDWTEKKDLLTEDKWTILSELQFKEALFTMKEDNDFHNEDYFRQTGDIYGQFKWIFGNEFVKGVQRIESPLSPTPLVKTPFGAITPALSTDDPKVNTRVLYWGGLKPMIGGTNSIWVLTGSTGVGTFSTYPYAGHFDDPISPTLDIHFGTPKFLYYNNITTLPTQTMFERYWRDWINQIEEGRMLTAKFYLDEIDISQIRDNFWAKIWIFDSWYYVNKIIDYQPLQGGLTEVELLKIRDGVQIEPEEGRVSPVRNPKDIREPDPIGVIKIGMNNDSSVGSGVVIGNNNNSGGISLDNNGMVSINKNLIVGNGNNLSTYNGVVLGDANTVTTPWGFVIGGEGVNITAPDVVVIGDRTGSEFNQPQMLNVGTGIKMDTAPKPSKSAIFNRGFNVNVEGYDLGSTDWRVVPVGKEVTIQPGKQQKARDLTVLGHYDIGQQGGTYSFGGGVRWRRGISTIDRVVNVSGLLTVGGELWLGVTNNTMPCNIGVFYSTINQNPIFINTPKKISLNTTGISKGISIDSNGTIIIDKPAYYRMTVTILLENLSQNPQDVIFWLKFNSVDYPFSGHFTTVAARKSAGVPSDSLISYEFIGRSLNPLDRVELFWQATSTDVELKTRTVSGIPQSPSVIVNINRICK